MEDKMLIGIGFMVRAMQFGGFGHEEIMAVSEAMITGDWSNIHFCKDCFTNSWDQALQDRITE